MFTVLFESALSVGLLLASNLLATHASVVPRKELHDKRDSSSSVGVPSFESAGALCKRQDGSFNSVNAIITVPNVTGSPGNAGAAIVALGGDFSTGQRSFLAGINFTIDADNQTIYSVEYGDYPSTLQHWSGSAFDISVNDDIQFTLEQSSSSSFKNETVTISNLNTGFTASYLLVDESTPSVTGANASWFLVQGPSNPLPFGIVTFKNASTGLSFCDPGESEIENISNKENERITFASATNTSLTVQFGSTAIIL